jgi:hypothetical protein
MPQTNHTAKSESAVSGGPGELFDKVELAAVALVEHGTLKAAAEAIGKSESTLRVWRKSKELRERVQALRQARDDQRLAEYAAQSQMVFEQLLSIIRDVSAAPTARVGAIREFRDGYRELIDRANSADGTAEFEEFERTSTSKQQELPTRRIA